MSERFHGIFTPLLTPVHDDGAPDLPSLDRLVRFQIDNGIHGLWAMGTSAEFASFDEGERAAAVETVVRAADGRVPVIANISDAATRLAIRHGRRAQNAGAAAVAVTPPYYYPHTQDELVAHYRAIREAIDLPLYIYNIPQTVRVKVELGTAKTLAESGIAAGIKDSQNDLEWFRQLVLFVRSRDLPFNAFVGTRHLIDAGMLAGADGAIPSIANGYPALCVGVYEAAARGDFTTSRERQSRIVEIESLASLVPAGSRNAAVLGLLKASLEERGILANRAMTAPLREVSEGEWEAVRERLQELGVIPVAGAR